MDGPYRDLGAGFARITGAEGARRVPSRITHVEDALTELLRNARDAGAKNVFVASSLKAKRYRTLTVLDDGAGIPETHAHLVFEPGVTSRHLDLSPQSRPDEPPHGAGLSLYHIRRCALRAEVRSPSSPTAITATFDTRSVPERSLQSETRPSSSNLLATTRAFVQQTPRRAYHHSTPSRILATLLDQHIIQPHGAESLRGEGERLGLEVSLSTARRVMLGEVRPVASLRPLRGVGQPRGRKVSGGGRGAAASGPEMFLGDGERREIAAILSRAAVASYLEVGALEVRSSPGELSIKVRVAEPEDEYGEG